MTTDTLKMNKPGKNSRTLVLLRHGESLWNKENLFSGWTDVDLSDRGKEEVLMAGRILKENGFTFDVAYTSVLKRAIRSLWIVLDEMDLMWIPVHRDWRLNERHYGALQGLNKSETAQKYGEAQVSYGGGVMMSVLRLWNWKTCGIHATIHAISIFSGSNFHHQNV